MLLKKRAVQHTHGTEDRPGYRRSIGSLCAGNRAGKFDSAREQSRCEAVPGMAMNAASYRRPVTGGTAKKPFFTAKTPKGADDHMETPFVSSQTV